MLIYMTHYGIYMEENEIVTVNSDATAKTRELGKYKVRYIHSRYMKTQHIKFEILNKRLSVFRCNLIQLYFVQNTLVIGRICDANFHPFGDVMDDVTKSLDNCHR